MKKRGFTLIELIVVLSIITILFTFSYGFIKSFKNREEKLTIDSSVYEIKALLSYSKSYCRKNKVSGKVVIDKNRKYVSFTVSNSYSPITRTVKMDSDIQVGSNFSLGYTEINEEGFIKNSGTIKLSYNDKVFKEIRIGAGNDIIGINEGDLIE